ncbi:MAG: hypothetical protein CBD74_05700, partial [Saprospirales bacterium TMED214]
MSELHWGTWLALRTLSPHLFHPPFPRDTEVQSVKWVPSFAVAIALAITANEISYASDCMCKPSTTSAETAAETSAGCC